MNHQMLARTWRWRSARAGAAGGANNPGETPAPRTTRSRSPLRAAAFTLVELLVVIGIITVLMGLLIPMVLSAHESAKATVCLSNLRQIAQAAVAYAGTHGRFPPSHVAVRRGAKTYNFDWDYSYVLGERPTPGVIWGGGGGGGGEKTPAVHRCPSWDGRQFTARGAEFSGYNYNVSYIGGEPQFGFPGAPGYVPCRPARLGALKDPARVVLFGDAQNNANRNNTYMRSPLPSPEERKWLNCAPGASFAPADDPSGGGGARRAGAQGFRHARRANAAFADGHAEAIADMHAPAGMPKQVGFFGKDNGLYGAP